MARLRVSLYPSGLLEVQFVARIRRERLGRIVVYLL